MNDDSTSTGKAHRAIRLARAVVPVVLIFLAVSVGPLWLRAFFLDPRMHGVYIVFLLIVEIVHGLLVATVPLAAIVLAVALARSRRRPARRAWLIRGLALCLSIGLGLVLAEAAAGAWLAWSREKIPATGREVQADIARRARPEPVSPAPARARSGLPTRFPDPTGENTVDILVLGESSARGVPFEEWFSVGEIVAWKLREAFPDRAFPVTHLARPGWTLQQVHAAMAGLKRRPDLVILYAGHNEFQSRYFWGHETSYYADRSDPAPVTLAGFAREHSPLRRLIQQAVETYRIGQPPPPSTSARPLVDVPVYSRSEYTRLLEDFRVRLEAMTAYCEGLGARVVLVIPPGNNADFEPNRSFLLSETPRAERAAFARDFEAIRRAEDEDAPRAVAAYRALLRRQPHFAEAHYRLARLLEAAGRTDEAKAHYRDARDDDGFPMRCPSAFQDAYRQVAARHAWTLLIDGPAELRALSPRGVVGDNCFTDGLHPSLIGYTALARAVLRALHAHRAFDWPESSMAPTVTPVDCAAHFGMDATKWRAVCDYAEAFYYYTALIRYEPTARSAKARRYHRAGEQIVAGARPRSIGLPGIGTQLISSRSRKPHETAPTGPG